MAVRNLRKIARSDKMKKLIRSYLKKALAIALVLGTFYFYVGWGLSASGQEALHRLVECLRETDGQAFEEPFEIAVDSSTGRRCETLDTLSMRAGSAVGKVRALPVTGPGLIIGLAMGTGGKWNGQRNAFEFYNSSFVTALGPEVVAITLGNTIHYAPGEGPETVVMSNDSHFQPVNVGIHEAIHTYQYETFGVMYGWMDIWLDGALERDADQWALVE